MKVLELQSTKEFASTFLNDIFFKMAVNRVLDAAPGFDLVYCKDCKWCDSCRIEWELRQCSDNWNNQYCSKGEVKTE